MSTNRLAFQILFAKLRLETQLLLGELDVLGAGDLEHQAEAHAVGAVVLHEVERVDAGAERLAHAPPSALNTVGWMMTSANGISPSLKYMPLMIMRATHRNRMSRAVESTEVG